MKSFALLLTLFLFPNLFFCQSTDWVLSSQEDEMEVYYRDGEQSKIKELKFTFKVESSLSSIVALLDDVQNYSKWVYKLDEAKIIDKISDREMYYYNVVDFPWPLNDRDMITHTRIFQDPTTKVVTSHSLGAPYLLKEKEEMVRIKTLEIKYIMKPNFDGSVTIDYYLKSDPAGNLPAWIINLALAYGPSESIKEFKKLLAEEPYKSAALPHILEP